jgi:hypothetical protein
VKLLEQVLVSQTALKLECALELELGPVMGKVWVRTLGRELGLT